MARTRRVRAIPRTAARAVPLVAACAAACAAPPPPPPDPGPPFDLEQAVLGLSARTQLESPTQIVFNWSAQEPGFRASGRGVARLEPPARARLDLFTGGEAVAVAALVDGDLRIPVGYDRRLIPPPTLLWATLGVFHRGRGLVILGGEREAPGRERLRLRNGAGEEFRVETEGGRLVRMERLSGGDPVESVELEFPPDGRFPASARYRDLANFPQLIVELESQRTVDGFPPDIWNPGG